MGAGLTAVLAKIKAAYPAITPLRSVKLEREGQLRAKLQDRFGLVRVGGEHFPRDLEHRVLQEQHLGRHLDRPTTSERVVAGIPDDQGVLRRDLGLDGLQPRRSSPGDVEGVVPAALLEHTEKHFKS